jgi:YHS domain-containing protein
MNFLARLVRFLFWVVFVSWSLWLVRRIVSWMLRDVVEPQSGSPQGGTQGQDRVATGANASEMPAGSARKLVRDPVCGMHLAEVLAIPLRDGGELVHFCSTACRDKYVMSTRKFAANG